MKGKGTGKKKGKQKKTEGERRTYSCLENIRDCHCEVKESKNRNSSSSITPHQVPLLSSTCPKESTPKSRFSVAIYEEGREGARERGREGGREARQSTRKIVHRDRETPAIVFLPPSLPPSLLLLTINKVLPKPMAMAVAYSYSGYCLFVNIRPINIIGTSLKLLLRVCVGNVT